MKVLLINGSPNEKGCTFTALSAYAAELEAAGIKTEFFQIGKEPIRGCTACRACAGGNGCAFGDGRVNELIQKARECDAFVVGSPVYFAGANGALLALLSRAFFAGGSAFAQKPAAAVASARRAGTTGALDILHKYFSFCCMPIVTSQYWNVIYGRTPEETLQDVEGLQSMRAGGRHMAWLLKCIEAGRQSGVEKPEIEKKIWFNFVR